MTDANATLQAVFATEHLELSESDRQELEQEQDILSIKHSILEDFADQQWQILVSELGVNLAGCLDIGIPDILLNAWKKTNELTRYCDSQQYPPGESVLVPLAEHVIESEHHPAIEVFVKKHRLGQFDFTVQLKLKLEGFLLKIQDCKIKSITTGTCTATGKIQFKSLTVAEAKGGAITLPGKIDLGEGIVIA